MSDNPSDSSDRILGEAQAVAGRDEPDSVVVKDSNTKDYAACDWQEFFPFENPYNQQTDAIEHFLNVLSDNGFYAVEGACGTGKTLIALVSGLYAIRNDSVEVNGSTHTLPEYERIINVTPVKQQLTQFVKEIRAINENLPSNEDQAPGLVLRGMTDLMAYSRADNLDFDTELNRRLRQAGNEEDEFVEVGGFRQQVSSIRETSRDLIREGSPVDLAWDIEPNSCTVDNCRKLTDGGGATRCPFHQHNDDASNGPWYDEVRAERIGELIANLPGTRLEVDGTTTPYPAELPTVRDVIPFQDELMSVDPDDPFDPFYARGVGGNMTVKFSQGANHVLDGDALVGLASAEGLCPHTTMGRLMSDAEIIVGNYNHLFDPQTRALTKDKVGILDRETIAVIDEGHMVEEKTRDMLSNDASVYTLQWARNDVRQAFELSNGIVGPNSNEVADQAQETAKRILEESSPTVTRDELKETLDFFNWVIETIDDIVGEYLHAEYQDWPSAIGDARPSEDSLDLQDPGTGETDTFTQRLQKSNFDESYCVKLRTISDAVRGIHRETNVSNRETVIGEVGELFYRWVTEGNTDYFREIQIEHSPHQNPGTTLPDWCEQLNATLHLYNCIPNRPIGAIYNELGGGITMSATLEPMEAYKQGAGLQQVADGVEETFTDTDLSESEASKFKGGRRVDDDTYGLTFPEANRASWTVTLPKYTYRNRDKPTQNYESMSQTRKKYVRAIRSVAQSPGNILLAMPNYNEAKWASALLERETDRTVYHDQSSTDEETTELLSKFFETGGVLITSSLGTVTEGVDYHGAKLHTAAVVGVPYKNTQSQRTKAVIEAYDQGLGEDTSGFDLAVGIPAVRKARQAIGRVLRGTEEVGTRIFLDKRYAKTGQFNVGQYLSEQEFSEFNTVNPEMLEGVLQEFWDTHDVTSSTEDPEPTDQSMATSAESDSTESPEESGTPEPTIDTSGTSKVYLGAGAGVGGWIPVPTGIVLNEIVPIVKANLVDDEADNICVNFSKEIPISGWNTVASDAVLNEIEPLVKTHRRGE